MLLNLSWPAVSQKSVDGTHTSSGVNMQTIKYICPESAFDQPVHWVPKAHEYIIHVCAYKYPTYDP